MVDLKQYHIYARHVDDLDVWLQVIHITCGNDIEIRNEDFEMYSVDEIMTLIEKHEESCGKS